MARLLQTRLRGWTSFGLLLLGALGLALSAGCPDGLNNCPCSLCGPAIDLTVIEEETLTPITDFFVEAIRDDETLGEPLSCQEAFREENGCQFGSDPGIYHIIVSAPGYATRETLARIAVEEQSEICCRACLSAKLVQIQLTPSSP